MAKGNKKQLIKDYFNFRILITEQIMKFIYMIVSALAVLGAFFGIIASWIGGIAILSESVGFFFVLFFLAPIGVVIGLVFSLVLIRIWFESILVWFLNYRELKEINEKTPEK